VNTILSIQLNFLRSRDRGGGDIQTIGFKKVLQKGFKKFSTFLDVLERSLLKSRVPVSILWINEWLMDMVPTY